MNFITDSLFVMSHQTTLAGDALGERIKGMAPPLPLPSMRGTPIIQSVLGLILYYSLDSTVKSPSIPNRPNENGCGEP